MIKEITRNDLHEITNLFIEVFNGEPWYDKWIYETAIKRLRDIIDMPGFIGNAYYEDNTLVGCIMGREEMFYDGKHFIRGWRIIWRVLIGKFCLNNLF